MNILHMIGGNLSGGAARGAYWLHQGLLEHGIDSKVFTSSKETYGDKTVTSIAADKKGKLAAIIRGQADIVHLHWICGGMVNMRHLAKVKKPMVWTMRDMWPMTGGCHYAMECERYTEGCGRCRQLGSSRQRDLSRLVY